MDLFATPLIPGLAHRDALITVEEETGLLAHLDAVDLAPFRFQGWTGKRLTASFGWHYDFDGSILAEAEPIPAWLLPLRGRAADFAGLPADDLAQVLVTRYDPGAGIGWHRDRPVFDNVVGVSLAARAIMRFRRRTATGFDRVALPLGPRSAYFLGGEARTGWEHGIAAADERRWSITFRSLCRPAAA